MRISACVITKNEEHNIVPCLNSMKSIVDEMIVVDTGSADNTIAIAKTCGAKVYNFIWENDFAAAKNFAIEKAEGDWIIFLDADEFFVKESIGKVKDYLILAEEKDVDAIMCQIINIDADCNNRFKDSFGAIRIFRKSPYIRYKNAIHEELVNIKRDKLNITILTEDLKIYHTGYSSSIVEKKLKRNLEIILNDIKKHGMKEKYYRYLCDCYHGLKDYEETVKYAKLHIHSKRTSLDSESIVYIKMLYALTQINTPVDEMKKEFEETIKIFSDVPDFYAQYANYLFDQKIYAKAMEYYLKAIEVYKTKANTQVASVFAGKEVAVYCNLGRLFLLKNEPEKALNYFCEVLLIDKFNEYAFQQFYKIIADYPVVQVIELLNSIYKRTKEELQFLVQNLNTTILNGVYLYYTNILKNQFAIEDAFVLPYQLLSLKKYDDLYKYSLTSLNNSMDITQNLRKNRELIDDEEVLENSFKDSSANRLKFILRRIENDIDTNENISLIIQKIIYKKCDIPQIVETMNRDIYKIAKVVVLISTALYKENMIQEALKLLLAMYKLHPQNTEIVYAFAYILILVQDKKRAFKILTNFKGEDEKIKALINEIGVEE